MKEQSGYWCFIHGEFIEDNQDVEAHVEETVGTCGLFGGFAAW